LAVTDFYALRLGECNISRIQSLFVDLTNPSLVRWSISEMIPVDVKFPPLELDRITAKSFGPQLSNVGQKHRSKFCNVFLFSNSMYICGG
jgi:hypothetical protein